MNLFSRGLRALAIGALFAVAASGATPALAAGTTTTITFDGLGDPYVTKLGQEYISNGFKFTTTATAGMFVGAFNLTGIDPVDTGTLLSKGSITMTKVGGGLFTYLSSKVAAGIVNSRFAYKVFADNPDINLTNEKTNLPLNPTSPKTPIEVVAPGNGWETNAVTWSTDTYNSSGIQLADIQVGPPTNGVPGPVAGAGLPALLAVIGGFVAWRRRKVAVAV